MEHREITTARRIVKTTIWIAVVATLVRDAQVTSTNVALVLVGIAVEIANERFTRSLAVTGVKCAFFVLCAAFDHSFALLAASASFDLALGAPRASVVIPVVVTTAVIPTDGWTIVILCSTLAATAGWIVRRYAALWRSYTVATDRERLSRHRQEETRRRLEQTSRELIRATEHTERTRIAHAIHDDVGHRLTGVLMQIQAARRLASAQPERSMRMLDTATTALTNAVESIRETVYDLRPRAESDAAAIRRICAEFRFCPVEVSLDDERYSALAEPYRDACLLTIRELLTNAARHSRAGKVRIRIDLGSYIGLLYEDDGIGSTTAREGLGIGGIRSRTEALGGTVVASGHNGFAVRIAIPLDTPGTEDRSG